MKLQDFFEETGMTKKHFASKVGLTYGGLYHILCGANTPSPATADNIVKFTKGKVSYQELFSSDKVRQKPGPKPKAKRKKKVISK